MGVASICVLQHSLHSIAFHSVTVVAQRVLTAWRITFWKLIFVSLSLVGIASCSSETDESSTAKTNRASNAPAVEIVQAKRGSLPLEQRLTGSVKARNQTKIFSEVSGHIVEVFINDGDFVSAGDKLLRV